MWSSTFFHKSWNRMLARLLTREERFQLFGDDAVQNGFLCAPEERPCTAKEGHALPQIPFAQQRPRYKVAITDDNRRVVQVEAYLPITDGLILMSPEGATHLDNGWA